MGQVERYGLYVLVLFIFLILGVAIWGDESQALGSTERGDSQQLSSAVLDPDDDTSLMDELQNASRNRALRGHFEVDEFDDELVDSDPSDAGGAGGGDAERGGSERRGSERGGSERGGRDAERSRSRPDPGPDRDAELDLAPPSLREYSIRSGDTLSEIAKRELGSSAPKEWKRIIALNPDLNPNRLRAGRKIKLPPRQDVVDRIRKASGDLDVGERSYVVRKGDSLSTIASRELGSIRHVKAIMRRNGLSDPGKLRIGRKLILPDVRSDAERD